MFSKKGKAKTLASKISGILAIMLIITFALQTFFSVSKSQTTLSEAINSEFIAIANQNRIAVESTLDASLLAAESLVDYISYSLETNENINNVDNEKTKSMIYNDLITESSYAIENYIINNMWALIEHNANIVAAGVYFEPDAFDAGVEDYSIYVTSKETQEKTAISCGSYNETYGIADWYINSFNSGEPCISAVYEYEGVNIISISYPIIIDNVTKGVVVVDINSDSFSNIQTTDEKYPSMYANVINEDGIVIYTSSNAAVGTHLNVYIKGDDMKLIQDNFDIGKTFNVVTKRTAENVTTEVSRYYIPVETIVGNWWVGTYLSPTDLNRGTTSLTIWMIIIACIALVAILVVTLIVVNRMLKPIGELENVAKDISIGIFDTAIIHKSDDELGSLSNSMRLLQENTKLIIDDMSGGLEAISNGNFTATSKCDEKYVGNYTLLRTSMYNILAKLSTTLIEVKNVAEQVNVGGEQVSSGAQELSQGATEQAAAVEELSATLAEFSSQFTIASDNTQNAKESVAQVTTDVSDAKEKMDSMMEAITEISLKSKEIGKIIKTIDNIAFQTNILALNAAVEAARAGVAGKGFAVVADEVKNLANKSAEAAKNTTQLIEDTINAVIVGTKMANDTSQSIQSVVSSADNASEFIEVIAETSRNQATNISQITTGMDQISSVVQTNSATAEESAASSEELSAQAESLSQLVASFKLRKDENDTH